MVPFENAACDIDRVEWGDLCTATKCKARSIDECTTIRWYKIPGNKKNAERKFFCAVGIVPRDFYIERFPVLSSASLLLIEY